MSFYERKKTSYEIYNVHFKMQNETISISRSMRKALLKVRSVLLLRKRVSSVANVMSHGKY